MRSFFLFFFLLIFSFLIQGIFPYLPFISIHLDLVWLIVLFISFFAPLVPGGISVFVIGLAQETLAAPFHGATMLSYVSIFLILKALHRRLLFEGMVSQFIWVFLLTLIQKGIEYGLLSWRDEAPAIPLWSLLFMAVIEAIASLILFPFLKNQGNVDWSNERRKVPLRSEWWF